MVGDLDEGLREGLRVWMVCGEHQQGAHSWRGEVEEEMCGEEREGSEVREEGGGGGGR